jgi:type VI secretion system secreted protein Hcp
MALDAFIKFTDLNGPVTRKGVEKFIEVLSFSFGASNTVIVDPQGGMSGGKPDVSNLNIMKRADATTPTFFTKCCGGTHFPDATLQVFKSGGAGQAKFLEYKLTKVFVTSYQVSASGGGDDSPVESLSLAFQKIDMNWLSQDDKGAMKNPIIASYDITNASVK